MTRFFSFWIALLLGLHSLPGAAGPLSPVNLTSPKETWNSFQKAMEAYRLAKEGSVEEQEAIERATRTLDLSGAPILMREEVGREVAILLKETLDRVVPAAGIQFPSDYRESLPKKWQVPDTEIVMSQSQIEGREGDYLFNKSTVERAREFYKRVAHLPLVSGKGARYKAPWTVKHIPPWAKKRVMGMATWQWLGLLVVLILGLIIRRIVILVMNFAKKFTDHSNWKWDDNIIAAVSSPIALAVATGVWYLGIKLLRIEGSPAGFISIVLQIVLSVAIIWLFYVMTDILSHWVKDFSTRTESSLDDQLVPLITKALKVFIVVFGVLVSVQNLGVNVMSLLAGLGLGGLAFALAAKDTAANLFGSIMILWDQPFRVGDWIVVDGAEGTVEEIGFRSTRIRTFYNSQISVPNSQIANTNIDNMGRRQYRRTLTKLGIAYNTAPELIEAFLEGLKTIIRTNPRSKKEGFHVVFSGFQDSALEIMLYFFLEVPDWSEELVARQNIYLEILRLADQLGVEFAFPTQTVHVESTPDHPLACKELGTADELLEKARAFAKGGSLARENGLGLFVPPHKG